jgi:hypothetical protein
VADGDQANSTQPLTDSQVVAVSQQGASKPKAAKVSKNDQSAWHGVVVGADEFAPARAKRSRAKWAIVGVLGVGGVGGGLYAAGVVGGSSASRSTPAQPPAEAVAHTPTPPPAAVLAQAPADAGVAAITIDAGLAVTPSSADAISSAAPPLKPAKATSTKKKPGGKKRSH